MDLLKQSDNYFPLWVSTLYYTIASAYRRGRKKTCGDTVEILRNSFLIILPLAARVKERERVGIVLGEAACSLVLTTFIRARMYIRSFQLMYLSI